MLGQGALQWLGGKAPQNLQWKMCQNPCKAGSWHRAVEQQQLFLTVTAHAAGGFALVLGVMMGIGKSSELPHDGEAITQGIHQTQQSLACFFAP